jgi:uncharacterized protein
LRLGVLDGLLAVCRLVPDARPPERPAGAALFSLTWTAGELSVVCPQEAAAGDDVQRGFRALVVAGPLDLGQVGVTAALAVPLAQAGVPILPLATHDTDYVLVRDDDLDRAIAALRAAGHEVDYPVPASDSAQPE